MFNIDATRSINVAPFVPVSFKNLTLVLVPAATALFKQVARSSSGVTTQTFIRSSSRFLEQAPRFTTPKPNLLGSNPILISLLLFGSALLIHELLSRNNIRPSNPQIERIPPLPLLAP